MTKRLARHTPTKTHRVSVPEPSRYNTTSIGGRQLFTVKSVDLAGEYMTEDWGRSWTKRIERWVYIDGCSIEEVSTTLRDQAAGMDNATLDIDRNDDGYPEAKLVGRRDATQDEVAEVLRFLAWHQEDIAAREQSTREYVIKQAKTLGIKPEDLA